VAIALGGGFGSVARYLASNAVHQWLGRDFPYGTLAVNVLGGLLMGALSELLITRWTVASEFRGLLLIGFLGGFTTFSTFSMETWNLLETGAYAKALLNGALSVVFCVFAVWIGIAFTRWIWEGYDLGWFSLESQVLRLLIVFAAAFAVSGLLEFFARGLGGISSEYRAVGALLLLGLGVTLASWFVVASRSADMSAPGAMADLLFSFAASAMTCAAGTWLGWLAGRQV
jgi:CrcB protein